MSTTLGTPVPANVDPDPTAVNVDVSDSALRIVLSDGRELSAPLAWFPRLRDATPEQRLNWEAIGRGHGIHWPDIDEDVSVRTLMGRPTWKSSGDHHGEHLPATLGVTART
jgi:hypothetical protein